ncbi:MAG TPA: ATP-grasp domain-containing protein [Limnobacter sp.]|uniref:ATP-grasp domain-containing protein n=1 Tax=Limnobacter sp. TaxID=2003368 RepID=UPI002EDA57B3
MATKPPKTLVLFNYDWDRTATQAIGHRWPHINAGFDLFSFPSNARLAWFDMDRFCSLMAWKAKLHGATGVMSNHEQFGALCAALLAEKMGWPGTPVSAVLACQHKLYARQVLDEVAPEANTPYQRLEAHYGGPVPTGLHYPVYVKPVKAAFSVLAAEVADEANLFKHTRFSAWELWVIRHLVEPFEKVIRQRLPDAGTAHSLMLEKPVKARQYCLDGYVFNGKLKTLGVVDAVMYPGTDAFMRFDFPSRLNTRVQERAADIARRFLHRVGFTHGLFNMEFFHDEHTDTITVIEFNPRMAAQFSDLYARVRGVNLHDIAFALAHGMDPALLDHTAPTAGTASSFVYRSFDPTMRPAMPTLQQRHALEREFPDSLLFQFPKDASEIARDFKWLRSYRYGIVHLGGMDPLDLKLRCEKASALLGWPAPYAGELSERELLDPLAHTTFEMELATG